MGQGTGTLHTTYTSQANFTLGVKLAWPQKGSVNVSAPSILAQDLRNTSSTYKPKNLGLGFFLLFPPNKHCNKPIPCVHIVHTRTCNVHVQLQFPRLTNCSQVPASCTELKVSLPGGCKPIFLSNVEAPPTLTSQQWNCKTCSTTTVMYTRNSDQALSLSMLLASLLFCQRLMNGFTLVGNKIKLVFPCFSNCYWNALNLEVTLLPALTSDFCCKRNAAFIFRLSLWSYAFIVDI